MSNSKQSTLNSPTLHHSPATLFSWLWWCNGIKLNNNALKGIKIRKMEKNFKVDGKLTVVHKNGQPYGIRDNSGYLLFFPKVTKYDGQEQRYVDEIGKYFALAEKIIIALL